MLRGIKSCFGGFTFGYIKKGGGGTTKKIKWSCLMSSIKVTQRIPAGESAITYPFPQHSMQPQGGINFLIQRKSFGLWQYAPVTIIYRPPAENRPRINGGLSMPNTPPPPYPSLSHPSGKRNEGRTVRMCEMCRQWLSSVIMHGW